MFSKFVDISRRITNGMKVWPGDPEVEIAQFASISSEGYCLNRISMGTHSGTHVDFPGHILEGNLKVPGLEAMIGPCIVASAGETKRFAADSRSSIERLIVKGELPAIDALRDLIENGLKLIGVESQSVDGGSCLDRHLMLLEAGVVIIEGLALQNVSEGPAFLIALPLSIDAPDGAPARVILAY